MLVRYYGKRRARVLEAKIKRLFFRAAFSSPPPLFTFRFHAPALTDDFWKKAVRNPFYRPIKTSTTLRLDTDVLLWLKSKGKGYQTRINAILREAMLKELHK